MWYLKIVSGEEQPELRTLKTGTISLGRLSTNDIILDDASASRRHAEITYDLRTDSVTLTDNDSTNGTYVNRKRITGGVLLQNGDVIRVGKVTINVMRHTDEGQARRGISGTHFFTRELILEALDQHAVLLYDVSRRLNLATDLPDVKSEITSLLKRATGSQQCYLFLPGEFETIPTCECQDIAPLAQKALATCSAEVLPTMMSVPVIDNTTSIIALICICKLESDVRPFDQRDLQLAVAFSYQASLALQRIELNEQVKKQAEVQQLLRRFLSPQEADYLLQDYLETGRLPELSEHNVTVMFSDMADSTKIAERVGTRVFSQLLCNYYLTATEIIFSHGGIVRYLGDGIMAVFMKTPNHPDPEEHAVRAGLELVQRLNATGALNDRERYIVGVAINTGKTMVGYVGTDDRAEFAALGDTVNVAFRMQHLARPYKVIIGPATMAAVVNKFQVERIGAVTLRGRENPIQIYEVLS